MARYLLSTHALIEIVYRNGDLPTFRWARTIDEIRDEVLVSAVSVGHAEYAVRCLRSDDPYKSILETHLAATISDFARRHGILDFTAHCARCWSQIRGLELVWMNPYTSDPESLPDLERQVVAQAISHDLPIRYVEATQPYHDILHAHGLQVLDPTAVTS